MKNAIFMRERNIIFSVFMKRNIIFSIFVFIFFTLFSCKTVTPIVEKETIKINILQKKLLNEASSLKFADIDGQVKISGNKDIPPVYIKFNLKVNYQTKDFSLKLSVLSKPLIDIYGDNSVFYLVNHTNKEYIKKTIENIDLSKVLGNELDPISLSYTISGKLPYSKQLQYMSYDKLKDGYNFNFTDQNSIIVVNINKDDTINNITINNQNYNDKIIIDYVSFDSETKLPSKIVVKTGESKNEITFVLKNISNDVTDIEKFKYEDYKLLDNFEDFKIILK